MPDLSDTPTTFSAGKPLREAASGAPDADDQPLPAGCDRPATFTLYSHGEVTALGWDGAVAIDPDPATFLQEVADLAAGAGAKALAIDLTGLERFPPGLLGGLPALVRRGVRVLLFNPTPDVRELLRVSHLDRHLGVHEVDVPAPR
ncbi:STAS domain-containing protein [Alienimonas californiensis]|uniref:STAS domain-containing protein n=1 Tax=Alienimonas californiensis TaxID=2527989 RepID=A0A517P9Z3_9PLAN|nr:hypothetical protein [Alienimonas californiensis]QDT16189.1 hypothetical protein CA12_22880 [Alienimonas californiensis]